MTTAGHRAAPNPRLEAATLYAQQGLPVFPLAAKSKEPLKGSHGCWDATTNLRTIAAWWHTHPGANVAIATGGHRFVLDVDIEDGGIDHLEHIVAKYGPGSLSKTLQQTTGGGGKQYFLSGPDDLEIHNSQGTIFARELGLKRGIEKTGIDVRGLGGYVVAPPSVHPNGREYEWDGLDPMERQKILPAPEWLVAAIREDQAAGSKSDGRAATIEPKIPKGHRHAALASVAGSLRNRGLGVEEIFAALMVMNKGRFEEPHSEKHVRQVAESICRYAPGSILPYAIEPSEPKTEDPAEQPAPEGKPNGAPRPRANSPKSGPSKDEDARVIRKVCTQLQLAGGLAPELLRTATHSFNGQCPVPLAAARVDEIVDWVLKHIRSGAAGGQTTASAAVEWENLIPLQTNAVPAIQPEWIPGPLGAMAVATARATETPLEMSALLGLPVVSCCLAGKFEVDVEPGYCEPMVVYTAPAMESGNRKTAVVNEMTRPLTDYESIERRRLEPEIKRAQNKRKTVEERINWLRKKAAKSPASVSLIQELADAEESLPDVPRAPQLWTQDTTSEKLAQLLADHGERMGLFSDEGDIFEVMAGRYNGGTPNFDIFLHGHSGSPVRVNRISRPDLFLDRPLLSVGLSPQPSVLERLRDTPAFRSRGLVARFLYALPPSPLGDRSLTPQPCPAAVRDAYRELILRLIRLTPPARDGVWQPWHLEFSPEAYASWKQFQRQVESMMREGGKLERLRDWGGKLPGSVARLAGLFHAVVDEDLPRNLVISGGTMARAIQLGTVLTDHALAVFDLMERDPTFDNAQKVLEWIRRGRRQTFTLRECFCAHQKRFGRVAVLRPVLELLVEHSHLRRAPQTSTRPRPSEIFEVSPRVLQEAT